MQTIVTESRPVAASGRGGVGGSREPREGHQSGGHCVMNLCGSFAVMFHRGVSVPKRVELYCKCAICCTSITHWRAVVKKLRCLAKTWEKRSESSYRGEVSGSHSERGTVGSEEDGVGESTGVQRDRGPHPCPHWLCDTEQVPRPLCARVPSPLWRG